MRSALPKEWAKPYETAPRMGRAYPLAYRHGHRGFGIAMTDTTGADVLANSFHQAGVTRIFGVPGGGSSLDLIEAAKQAGIDFVLARHEMSAIVMAATTAELAGTPGVALCTRGPGVGNAANGMAQAALDRAPVVLVADGFSPSERAYATHQYFDHAAMLAPVTKDAVQVGQWGPAKQPPAPSRRPWPRHAARR